VNLLGSDTDTISCFLGALIGAKHGIGAIPSELFERIQDRDYILKVGARVHAIVEGNPGVELAESKSIDRKDAYLKILAWELGLHEMFWDAIDVNGIVYHPALGRGTITYKDVKKIAREGFVAKLIGVRFDCGQTCTFHSSVERNEKVAESFSKELTKALETRT
jgi:hypothetical protein